ncbi:hypothetical protein [Ideonella sp.]|jgi:hypothetical protein|uniref:hypothetical protein n=1 Tax=Ideonella sp. TaxID=1929293 RepID=UPI0037C027F5
MPPDAPASPPGRSCPLRYHYGPRAIAQAPLQTAHTLYVAGGLYGNTAALAELLRMVAAEPGATLIFNGDFNWFNVRDADFVHINQAVLQHHALQGNVEAEFHTPGDEADCGCAYPAAVDDAVVQRSNAIHRQLKATARRHPELLHRLAALPMVARFQVGEARVGMVHGDAQSLAGWGFDAEALQAADAAQRYAPWFEQAEVELFACSHTCAPGMAVYGAQSPHAFHPPHAGDRAIVNNGATGMPNRAGDLRGLVSRIALKPSPHPVWAERQATGVYVALLPVAYDTVAWAADFSAQWPEGSAAALSYGRRMLEGA